MHNTPYGDVLAPVVAACLMGCFGVVIAELSGVLLVVLAARWQLMCEDVVLVGVTQQCTRFIVT
jgi:hypothetical protein